ncbi:MAG TPA: hypothetical protein PK231_03030 [Acidocella sp.]|nr:hypothetical protein [Acidocella sp.]
MTVGSVNPFKPAVTVTISGGTTSTNAALTVTGDAVVVYNSSSDTAFVRTGNGAQVAETTDYPVPAGARALIATGPYINNVAVVLASGSGNVYVTVGDGTQY